MGFQIKKEDRVWDYLDVYKRQGQMNQNQFMEAKKQLEEERERLQKRVQEPVSYTHLDISGKVRSHQKIKREKGEFIGAFAPYGYLSLIHIYTICIDFVRAQIQNSR